MLPAERERGRRIRQAVADPPARALLPVRAGYGQLATVTVTVPLTAGASILVPR